MTNEAGGADRSLSTAAGGLEDRSIVAGWAAGMEEVEPVELSKRSPESALVIAGNFRGVACVLAEVGVGAERARARRRIGRARKARVVGRLSRSSKTSTSR